MVLNRRGPILLKIDSHELESLGGSEPASWDSQAASASDRMARIVGQCMDEQGWIFCTWHQGSRPVNHIFTPRS
jgi:hypothetical protein